MFWEKCRSSIDKREGGREGVDAGVAECGSVEGVDGRVAVPQPRVSRRRVAKPLTLGGRHRAQANGRSHKQITSRVL